MIVYEECEVGNTREVGCREQQGNTRTSVVEPLLSKGPDFFNEIELGKPLKAYRCKSGLSWAVTGRCRPNVE
jgi:hypothetical protein